MTLETLVVAVGPNDVARTDELTEAILDIAEPTGASVVFVHAFSEKAFDSGVAEAGFDPDDPPSPDELATRLECIDTISATLEETDVSYDVRGVVGSEAESVLNEIAEIDGDLLYLSGRKRSPTGKAVFGSTAHRLMMNSTCPVLFVREGIYGGDE